jgi:hypothetical protein
MNNNMKGKNYIVRFEKNPWDKKRAFYTVGPCCFFELLTTWKPIIQIVELKADNLIAE